MPCCSIPIPERFLPIYILKKIGYILSSSRYSEEDRIYPIFFKIKGQKKLQSTYLEQWTYGMSFSWKGPNTREGQNGFGFGGQNIGGIISCQKICGLLLSGISFIWLWFKGWIKIQISIALLFQLRQREAINKKKSRFYGHFPYPP